MIEHIRTISDREALKQGYYFDAELAEKCIAKMESLFCLSFYRWQREALYLYFGWRSPDGGYRFTDIRIWIPKKNGKSWIISALVAFKLFELTGAKIYSVATVAQQAKIVMDGVMSCFKKSPKIKKHVKNKTGKIRVYETPRRAIQNLFTDSTYYALAKGVGSNDGIIPDVVIIDEIHQMGNDQIDIIDNSTANLPKSLKVIISTAGSGDKTHRSWQKYIETKRVLSGEVVNVRMLAVVYEHSNPDAKANELYSLKTYLSCNPVAAEDEDIKAKIIEDLEEAKRIRNDGNWKRYRLNIWCAQDGDEYIASTLYAECVAARKTIDELSTTETCVGIDIGGTWDFTGVSFLHTLPDGSLYESHSTFAVEDRIPLMSERDQVDYQAYVDAGELTVIPAIVPMDEWLYTWIDNAIKFLKLTGIGADPYFARYILERLQADGKKVVQIQQSNNRLLTPAIDEYLTRVRQKSVTHAPNTLYDWQLANARKIASSKDAAKIVKAGSNSRGKGGVGHIDNVDAIINAFAVYKDHAVRSAIYGNGGLVCG